MLFNVIMYCQEPPLLFPGRTNVQKAERTYRSQLRSASKCQTIESILDATVRLHGEGTTDVEAVAREAGVSVATVRKYFPTREDLFRGCTEHFLRTHRPPSLDTIGRIRDSGERLAEMVRQVYNLHGKALGHAWLAYQMQSESPVMARTVAKVEGFVSIAVDVMLHDWSGATGSLREELFGYARGLLSPLTYRAMRLPGSLSHEAAVEQTTVALATMLDIALPDQFRNRLLTRQQHNCERGTKMIGVNLKELTMLEGWYENDPSTRSRVAFPLYAATGAHTSAAVYFELDPGMAVGTHTDSAEEILFVVSGGVEVTLGEERATVGEGHLLLIPAMLPHNVRNVGTGTARLLGFFASCLVQSTFDQPSMPTRQQTLGTPPVPTPNGPLPWNQVAQMVMTQIGQAGER